MSEEVKSFIDKLAQNDMVGVDAFKDSTRKSSDALDNRRQEIAAICLKQNLIVIQNQKFQVQIFTKDDKLNSS